MTATYLVSLSKKPLTIGLNSPNNLSLRNIAMTHHHLSRYPVRNTAKTSQKATNLPSKSPPAKKEGAQRDQVFVDL